MPGTKTLSTGVMAIFVDDVYHPVPANDLEKQSALRWRECYRERLEGARQSLRRRAIEGDGDCALRVVAVQDERYGDDGQSKLRHAAVAYVEARHKTFMGFFGEGNSEQKR